MKYHLKGGLGNAKGEDERKIGNSRLRGENMALLL
jgi:hypothetical protein